MYACFTSYYKHGEVDCKIIETDKEMKEFCLEELEDYGVKKDYSGETLDKLIKKVMKLGEDQINEQRGWGVRYIVKGKSLSFC